MMDLKALLFFSACFLSLPTQAQLYPITALDGTRQQIRLRYEYPNFDLRFYYGDDTLTIPRVRNIKHLRYLSPQLLAVTYSVVAGSDEDVAYTSLYCVSGDRLIMAWNQCTLENDNVYNEKTKKFHDVNAVDVKLKLLGSVAAHNVRLILIQKHQSDTLRFNDAIGCFYNSYKTFDAVQRVCIGDSDMRNIYFKGRFPAITINKVCSEIFTTDGYYYWSDSLWRRQYDCLPF